MLRTVLVKGYERNCQISSLCNLFYERSIAFLQSEFIRECDLVQCFSTARPRPGTGPWHQSHRAARGLRKLQYTTRFQCYTLCISVLILFMIMPQLIINIYVSSIYELKKKLERYLRVNLLGLGPRFIKKRIYRAAVSQRLRNTDLVLPLSVYCTFSFPEGHPAAVYVFFLFFPSFLSFFQ